MIVFRSLATELAELQAFAMLPNDECYNFTNRECKKLRLKGLKNRLKQVFLLPGVAAPFRRLIAGSAVIFMLHRFQVPELGIEGNSPHNLRTALVGLRKRKYRFASLVDILRSLEQGADLSGTVGFTIDDGYWEQGLVAGPVFAEFDCPVTTFLCTGFLDGQLWFWWDRIEYIFLNTKLTSLQIRSSTFQAEYEWQTDEERSRCQAEFTEACKEMSVSDIQLCIEALASVAGVELPKDPPRRYAPLTWDQARECERHGMTFGPHTLTHSILSRTSDAQSEAEILKSWMRLRQELKSPAPVFCYPNGQAQDFGAREFDLIRKAGMLGAVTGCTGGYASAAQFRETPEARFKVGRFSMPSDLADVLQYVNGVYQFKAGFRGKPAE